jgi:SSS family solute:Na+ symporter
MDLKLFICVLFALQFICFFAGSWASRRLKSQSDYFLAGKDIKFFPLMMTFIATQVGGGVILGASEEAYQFGWWVILYPLGGCLGFLLLAGGIGRRLAQFDVSTVAQLFEVVYKSPSLKKIASLLSMASLFLILIAQVMASKKFMIALGVDQTAIFLVFWSLIIAYTVVGGLKAVVSIDVIQASFFIIVFVVGFGYVAYASDVPVATFFNNSLNAGSFDFDASKLTGWLFMPLLFMVIEQDMAQRCFAAQSPRIVTKAAIWSAVVMFWICLIPIFFGILARSLNLQIDPGSSVFMTVTQAVTTPALAAFLGVAVLMAIISTAISLINAVSSNLMQDFRPGAEGIQSSRWITAAIGTAAVLGSFYFNNVVDLMIQSYELSVYCLFVPVVIALFKRYCNKESAIFAIGCGAIGFIFFRFYTVAFPKEIICVAFSAIGYGVGEVMNYQKVNQISAA